MQFLEGSPGPGADGREALVESLALCETIERLLRNLGLLARGGEPSQNRQLVAFSTTVAEAVARCEREAQTSGVVIRLVRPPSPDTLVHVDRELFTQAVDNLLAFGVGQLRSGGELTVEVRFEEGGAVVAIERAPAPAVPPRLQLRYGRGLALLCAAMAAEAAGATLEDGPRLQLSARAGT